MKTKIAFVLVLVTFCGSAAFADVPIQATLCNHSTRPVEFHLFNHNDIASGLAALSVKSVRACACVSVRTHTDLWHNAPVARVNQLVYRDVQSVSGSSIKACVDVDGKFEGYIDASVKTCVEARKETKYLPAPELTHAQGDLPILQSHLYVQSFDCKDWDWTGGCSLYDAEYDYTDGAPCHGN